MSSIGFFLFLGPRLDKPSIEGARVNTKPIENKDHGLPCLQQPQLGYPIL